jgi:hypothetical protein
MMLRTRGRLSVMYWSRILGDRLLGTPFARALARARRDGRREFVFGWNRGLGDIALGLVPLFVQIRAAVPGSRIAVFTRAELAVPFELAGADAIHVIPGLERDTDFDLGAAAARVGIALPPDATVFADPDPTRWLGDDRRAFPPALRWDPAWNALADRLAPPAGAEVVIGAHVHSETARYYGYVKDWPVAAWQALFARFPVTRGVRWVLFGNAADAAYAGTDALDLRGRTDFLELLAVIRTRCRILVAPDSGVLTATYYLADDFPLEIVSLWSDPRQGVLKQGCPSPNPSLRHVPLQGPGEDLRNLSPDDVAAAVEAALSRCSLPSTPDRAQTNVR